MLTISRASREQADIVFDRNVTDVLKFLACLMVGMSHYSGYALANGLSRSVVYQVIAANGGYLGVALFFLLSGYGLMKSDMNNPLGFVPFLKRRLSKTYFPAVLVSLIWLITSMLIGGGTKLLCNQRYLLGLIWDFNDEVMWFVNAIIILYVCFYLFRLLSRRCSAVGEAVALMGIAIVYLLVDVYALGKSPLAEPLFFAGVAVARWPKRIRAFVTRWWTSALTLVVMAAIAYWWRADNRVLHGVIDYFCAYVFIVILTLWNIRITARVPKWVGSNSYDFYLVHYKTHLLIVYLTGVDALWSFVGCSAVATIAFYNLRKLLRL